MKWTIKKKSAVQTNEYVDAVLDKFIQKYNLKLEKDGRVRRYYTATFLPNTYIMFRYDGNIYKFAIARRDGRDPGGYKNYEVNNNDLIKAIIEFENKLTNQSRLYKNYNKQKEQPKEQEQQSKSKTVYSVELFNNEGDTETSTDCNSYDEAIKAIENYKNNKTQYIDSWGLSGKGRIIKFTEDEDDNISNEKVLKTFWL